MLPIEKDDIVLCVLQEGLDDWVMIDTLIGRCREWAEQSGEAVRGVFTEVLRRMLSDELVVVGDLRGEGFTDWVGRIDDVIGRVEVELDGFDWNPRMASCWLRNTDAGDELARSVGDRGCWPDD
ncbi:hypothetical protein ACDF64_07775 [Agromyces sp. MMS24-JH15]|uniref:hypothetical protein n=1 Tax=Agromyces sp. MMS24-JH15 TaxID=3243765 RepID=UPI00374A45CC